MFLPAICRRRSKKNTAFENLPAGFSLLVRLVRKATDFNVAIQERNASMPAPLRRCLLLGIAALAAPAAHADYLWLAREVGQPATAYLSEFQPTEHLSPGGLLQPQALLAEGKTQPLQVQGDALSLSGVTSGDLRASARRANGKELTLYEAREGRHETRALNDLELVPTSADGNTFALHWKGTVVAASQVNVYTSEQWTRTLKPAADGSITLETPFPGRYVLQVTAQVNGAATVDGQRYDSVVHVATLSFTVPQ
jgi:hypothetical protein